MNQYSKLLQHPLLSKDESYSLIEQYQNTFDSIIKSKISDKLIKANFKYIFKLSVKFHSNHREVELDEFIQCGSEAMLRTLDKFDLKSGYTILTYYTAWHYSFCQRYWAKHKRVLRIPIHVLELARSIRKVQAQYEMAKGTPAPLAWVATELKITPEKIKETLLAVRPVGSLNSLTFNDDGNSTELLDLITDTEENSFSPDDYLTSVAQSECINNLLATLEPADRKLLILKFNLNNLPSAPTLNQISKNLGITREQVRARCNRAINSLRKSKEIMILREFI